MSKAIVVRGHHSGGPFTLLGIPGIYENGVPYPLEKTQRTEKEMRTLFASLAGLAVEFVDEAEKKSEKTTAEPAESAAKEG